MEMRLHRWFYLIPAIIILLAPGTSSATVTADPSGFGAYINDNDQDDLTITLSNDGEFPVAYSVMPQLNSEYDGGPRRDDAGDQIDNFDIGYRGMCGLAWDGEWIWGTSYTFSRLVALDPVTEDIEVDVDIGYRSLCMTYLNGLLWICPWGQGTVRTYDLDGEAVDSYNLAFQSARGITTDKDNLLFFVNNNDGRINVYEVTEDGIDRVNFFAFSDAMGGNAIYSIEWVPAHRQGMLWGHYNSRMYQAEVIGDPAEDDVDVEAVSNFQWNADAHYVGLAHDGENMWHGMYNSTTVYVHDDGISEFSLLSADPYRGTIPSDSTTNVTMLIDSDGIADGIYHMVLDFELDDANQSNLVIDALVSVDEYTGDIQGEITDASDNSTIEGIYVEVDGYRIFRYTDENGDFRIDDLPPGDYTLNIISDEYIDVSQEFSIDAFRTTSLEIGLRSAQFVATRDDIIIGLPPGDQENVPLTVRNPGAGDLEWEVEIVSNAAGERDPWEYLFDVGIEEITEDAYLNGITYADGYYYMTGGNSGGDQEDPNYVYILDEGFRYVGKFEQFGTDNFGMYGITYDGTYLYGVEYDQIWVFTTDGELVDSLQTPSYPTKNIAYDSREDLLWISTSTGTVYGLDTDGDIVENIDHPVEGRIYAFEYFREDPDGYYLYMQTRTEDGELRVSKMDTETEDVVTLADLDINEATLAGMMITSSVNADSWTLASIVKTQTDWLGLWHMEYRHDWLRINPTIGVIRGGGEQDFSVRIDTDNFPRGEYLADLLFTHNGVGGETTIPVELTIEDGRVPSSIYINLRQGWNIVSANLEPDEPDIREIFSVIAADSLLDIVKDFRGEVYIPKYNVNSIGDWKMKEGYQIRCFDEAEIVIDGLTALSDTPIDLHEGWQIISYFPDEYLDVRVAFENIDHVLTQVKDDYGRFYLPQFGFSNMPAMSIGKGYRLNVTEDIELVYNVPVDTAEGVNAMPFVTHEFKTPVSYPEVNPTGEDMSLLVIAPDLSGDEIGIYVGDMLVGSGVIEAGKAGIPVRGDDVTTELKDGALAGDPLFVMLHDGDSERMVDYTLRAGEMEYTANGLAVIELAAEGAIADEFGLATAYPNPFNSSTRISYSLPEAANITIKAYDLSGRLVQTIYSGKQRAGLGEVHFDGSTLPTGMYFVELKAGSLTSRQKVMLLK